MTDQNTKILLERITGDGKELRDMIGQLVIGHTRSEERIKSLQSDVGRFQELCERNTQKIIDIEKSSLGEVQQLRQQLDRFKMRTIVAMVMIGSGLAANNANLFIKILTMVSSA